MFRCKNCSRVVGPRIPESRVAVLKPGNKQIRSESALCPHCAATAFDSDDPRLVEIKKDFIRTKTTVIRTPYEMRTSKSLKSKS